jgi:hypothetical protein
MCYFSALRSLDFSEGNYMLPEGVTMAVADPRRYGPRRVVRSVHGRPLATNMLASAAGSGSPSNRTVARQGQRADNVGH